MGDDGALTVTQLNEYVRRMMAGDPLLRSVSLRGEIANYKRHISGHRYFSLRDAEARVSCAMFRQSAARLNFEPTDGMKVVVSGSVSLYVRDGAYQVYCDSIRREGAGDLFARYEALKRKLEREGLFDASLKKPIHACPGAIGVVTSPTGAAIRDIIRVSLRRNPRLNIIIAPSPVQGEGAAAEIAEAIGLLNADGRAEAILCGRGGGSMEDLWAFNEEIVARAISASRIPVISCVGHETDFTLADFVADLRAPTPSAAAELAVPVAGELLASLSAARARLTRNLSGAIGLRRARLDALAASPCISSPEAALLRPAKWGLADLEGRLEAARGCIADRKRGEIALAESALRNLNPSAVLSRGYSVVRKGGAAVSSARELSAGDEVSIAMRDGDAAAAISKVCPRRDIARR